MAFDIQDILRKNIASLVPYSSARNEYSGQDAVFLDANESPYNSPLNRYPDPLQWELKKLLSRLLGIPPEKIFLGNGSDEAIDLLMRAVGEPGEDEIISIDPSYGMYEVCAAINNLKIVKILLNSDFSLNTKTILEAVNKKTKIIFLCSPNNPTANLLNLQSMKELAQNFNGLLVVDEAYIDFSESEGMLPFLDELKNVVVLRTLSKAWALAGIRLGMAIASEDIIRIMNRIKYPYNINILTQQKATEMLHEAGDKENWVKMIRRERERLIPELDKLEYVVKVFPSDANFLLVKFKNPLEIYEYLKNFRIIVRDRSQVSLCEGCLRITIGSRDENSLLLEKLKEYKAGGQK